ncbi:hypothetical protein BUALT_Bualt06G0065400 [Buddleja alternifolia]|uniref:DCD domain-containing protein n=1 Tax=Buddleja alternifolia TaxID=168488 RepID=A0AAV6XCS4_9LAMI|nr:hypothetical protein BUALT_Bualt06G0065400 [Buddleja alternifolia]
MGAGRKTRTLHLKENSEVSWTVNSNALARNLRKNELGAVIFGCKHHTFKECLLKQIFGLPAAHFSYVKNVAPGLALFLFNYSDRTLHGIFEAKTAGQMNINPYAWITSEGAESTPYAAQRVLLFQVRVDVRRQCRPLFEEEFKPIISKNYYAERLFWFELDKEQANRLIKLFQSSPLPEKIPHPPNAAKWNNMFDVLSEGVNEAANDKCKDVQSEEYSGVADMKLKETNEHSYASVLVNRNTSASGNKWAELFETSSSLYTVKNGAGLQSQKLKLNSSTSDCFDMEWEFASASQEPSKPRPQACLDATNTEFDSYVAESWEEHAIENSEANEICENESICLQENERDSDGPDMPSSENSESVVDKAPGEALMDTEAKVRSDNALASLENCESDRNHLATTNTDFRENDNTMYEGVLLDIQCSDFQSVVVKLMQEIEGLKVSELKQRQKVIFLGHELFHSKLEIDQLKKRCHKLESMASSTSDLSDLEACEIPNFSNEESVLIVGGFDGYSWLQDLSSYSPSEDHVISLCPMTFSRSYASLAKLNGELYLFGGTHDGAWYETVESYNPISNQWVQRPPLNQKKGSMAGASMYEKIFAIGGGNGVECFSEVELFDINIGRWISTQSMLEKRFAPAAADVNGALYVAGGYDGRDYLRSVERFDPREHAWTGIASMNTKRGCHSLVAFKEKLYALGGYDGDSMVPTVEVFDPRVGSWMMDESMTVSRGHFGSFVLGGKMYVIGGVEEKKVLDVVECYEEGSGWQVSGLTAIGKRCFFSTLVL